MGSGSSSHVKPIGKTELKREESSFGSASNLTDRSKRKKSDSTAERRHSHSSGRKKLVLEKVEQFIASPDIDGDLEQQKALKTRIENLELQVNELESSNIDLLEELQAYEEKIESMHNDKVANKGQECNETVKIKDQYIKKLEEETQNVQNLVTKLKAQFKKSQKAAKRRESNMKQETSVQMFALKTESSNLQEENQKLKEQIEELKEGKHLMNDRENTACESSQDNHDDSRMKVILELSSKVSEQDAKICQLENDIRERDKVIADLKAHSKRSADNKSSQKSRRLSNESVSDEWTPRRDLNHINSKENDLPASCKGGSQNISNVTKINVRQFYPDGDSPEKGKETTELQQIAQEMKKSKKKGGKKGKAQKERQFSGISRDSGIIQSQGHLLEKEKPHSNWKENLTDTSWSSQSDTETFTQSRISSASRQMSSAKSIRSTNSDSTQRDPDIKAQSPRTLKLENLRSVSAPKKKKKHVKELDLDALLNQDDVPTEPPPSYPVKKNLAAKKHALKDEEMITSIRYFGNSKDYSPEIVR